MNEQLFSYAKEEIRKALVVEYVKRNPGIREQDVVMSCVDDELVFTHISAIMSDIHSRKHYSQGLAKAKNLFSEMAIHRNEHWLDCVVSTRHSTQIIDCLHSTLLNGLSRKAWEEEHDFLAEKEAQCARMTVKIHDTKKRFSRTTSEDAIIRNKQNRRLLICYLKQVIDQLKTVHSVYQKEVTLGDTFADESGKYMEIDFPKIDKTPPQTTMESLLEKYKTLKDHPKASVEQIYELNVSALNETRKLLEKTLDAMKQQLHLRRDQYEKIWAAIVSIQDTVQKMENNPVKKNVTPDSEKQEEPSASPGEKDKFKKRVMRF